MATVFLTHPTDKLTSYYGANALAALQSVAAVRFNPESRELTTQELIAAAQNCDFVIAYRQTPGPEMLFRELPDLLAFLRCAVDIRTVDVAAASAQGVLVTQASAGYVTAVTEWVIAAMLDLGRGISRYAHGYQQDRPLIPFMGRELRGSVVGIIGLGQIGQRLSELALALGMQVQVTTPQPVTLQPGLRQVPLTELLAESDFVVCLAPANAQTEYMMNAQTLGAMKRDAFFINAARGELVDEAALLQVLDSGRLAGCAMDVGRAPDQMPSAFLARHPRVLATPHIGGLTQPAIEHQAMETVAQLRALLKGESPTGAVNAEQATRWDKWRTSEM